MSTSGRARLGASGEQIAAAFLERRGGRVLDRNVEVSEGEIDLVVAFGRRRVAVEVRSRWAEDPLTAFDDTKLDRVRRSALRLSRPCHRIDLITIEFSEFGAEVRWLPDM